MKVLNFVATQDFDSNFKTMVNGTPITVVVAQGDKFTKGSTIKLEAVARKTGEGFYLRRAVELVNITLVAETIDESTVTDNVISEDDLGL